MSNFAMSGLCRDCAQSSLGLCARCQANSIAAQGTRSYAGGLANYRAPPDDLRRAADLMDHARYANVGALSRQDVISMLTEAAEIAEKVAAEIRKQLR